MASVLDKLGNFDEADRGIRSMRPEIEALWVKTAAKRGLSEFLLRARYRAGLSQSQVAERAGWDKSFVSRMESVSSPISDLATIARYVSACGEFVGLCATSKMDSPIIDAVLLNAADLKQLEGQEDGVKAAASIVRSRS